VEVDDAVLVGHRLAEQRRRVLGDRRTSTDPHTSEHVSSGVADAHAQRDALFEAQFDRRRSLVEGDVDRDRLAPCS